MIEWLATKSFNNFDLLWFGGMVLAANDKRFILAFIIMVIGLLISDFLEHKAQDS